MTQTRRQFIGTAAAATAIATAPAVAAIPPGPPRLALDAFAAGLKRLASLRRGVAVMKARAPSDHKSWFFQSAIHAYSDALYNDALTRDAKLAAVDGKRYWNRCPHFGQASADFVIWHRAYLYYFERVLRDAAQDANLSLPYWNYALPADRTFPDVFGVQYLDAHKTLNSLYHPNRELAFVTGRLELSGVIGEAHAANGALNFFHEPGVPGLAGDHLGPDETQIGLLEQRPHNDIHLAVGGVVNSFNGAMAEITTAAFDPVFWVHHANIDRMWAAWLRVPGKRWGTMPPEAWWDEKPWIFLDVDGTEQSLSRRAYFAREASYDGMNGAPLLQLAQPALVAATGGSSRHRTTRAKPGDTGPAPAEALPPMVGMLPPPQRRLFADAGAISVSPKFISNRLIASLGADRVESPVGGARNTLAPPDAASLPAGARVFLELVDIHFDRVPSSGFAVFLDRAQARAAEPVGLIDLFGATHAQMPGMTMKVASQRFEVTRFVHGGQGALTLRIEPYNLLVSKTGLAAAQRDDSVHIGSVKFVVVS